MAAEFSHLLSEDQMKQKYVKTVKDIFCNLIAAKVAREVRGKGNALFQALHNNCLKK